MSETKTKNGGYMKFIVEAPDREELETLLYDSKCSIYNDEYSEQVVDKEDPCDSKAE